MFDWFHPAWPTKRSLDVHLRQPCMRDRWKLNFVVGKRWWHRLKGLDLGSNICQYESCGRVLILRCALWTLYLRHIWRLTVQQQNMLQTQGQRFWKGIDLYYNTRGQTNRWRYYLVLKPWKKLISPSYQWQILNLTKQLCSPGPKAHAKFAKITLTILNNRENTSELQNIWRGKLLCIVTRKKM